MFTARGDDSWGTRTHPEYTYSIVATPTPIPSKVWNNILSTDAHIINQE